MLKQKGAALVTVMVFLASGLMLGVSIMKQSSIDRILAHNFQSTSAAQMAAEQAAVAGWIFNGNKLTTENFKTSESYKSISDLPSIDLTFFNKKSGFENKSDNVCLVNLTSDEIVKLTGLTKNELKSHLEITDKGLKDFKETEEGSSYENEELLEAKIKFDIEKLNHFELYNKIEKLKKVDSDSTSRQEQCYFRHIRIKEGHYIIAMGAIGNSKRNIAISEPIFIKLGVEDNNMALLAGESINIDGDSTINGRAHANESINAKLTQQDSELDKRDDDGLTSGYAISLPEINFSKFSEKIELSREEGKGKDKGSYYCDFNLSGNLGGKIYYCNGNVEINSSFENATILSEGKVEDNKGSITLGKYNSDENVKIISKGSISFSGSSIVYGGIFLSGKSINQNGSSVFYGSLTAYENINRNGAAQFVYKKDTESMGNYQIESWNGVDI